MIATVSRRAAFLVLAGFLGRGQHARPVPQRLERSGPGVLTLDLNQFSIINVIYNGMEEPIPVDVIWDALLKDR